MDSLKKRMDIAIALDIQAIALAIQAIALRLIKSTVQPEPEQPEPEQSLERAVLARVGLLVLAELQDWE